MTLILVVVVAVTAGVAAYYRGGGSDGDVRLRTAAVSRGSVVQTVDATGTLEAVTTVAVGTQVSGAIKALHADYNSQVRKGQVIAQLEPSLFQAQVEQARATVQRLQADADAAQVRLDDARIKLTRAQELAARQLIPAAELDVAQVTVRQAEASLKGAEAQRAQGQASLRNYEVNLGHTTIRAPIDGIVISRNVDVGQTVAASMSAPTLFVLAQDLRRMQVNASVDESDIGRIEAGQNVAFRVDAYPEATFAGTVRQVRLEPVVTQNVVTYVTVIDVPNPDLALKPGMTANVTIEIARADDVLRVPNAALNFRPAPEVFAGLGQEPPPAGAADSRGAGVWVLAGGGLARHAVRTGLNDGTATAVVGGELQEGAEVVTSVAAATATTPQASGSPLLPQRPGAGRPPGAR
jgi:HlyD family secretion protein